MKTKFILFFLLVISSFLGTAQVKIGDNNTVLDENIIEEIAYASFGEKIVADDALTTESMALQYKGMKIGDTINIKMAGKIKEVCSTKGCWMSRGRSHRKSSGARRLQNHFL